MPNSSDPLFGAGRPRAFIGGSGVVQAARGMGFRGVSYFFDSHNRLPVRKTISCAYPIAVDAMKFREKSDHATFVTDRVFWVANSVNEPRVIKLGSKRLRQARIIVRGSLDRTYRTLSKIFLSRPHLTGISRGAVYPALEVAR
jgi:hypothetical protein